MKTGEARNRKAETTNRRIPASQNKAEGIQNEAPGWGTNDLSRQITTSQQQHANKTTHLKHR